MYVIGTAGHVDHGKSTLVTALTGIDPDRLKEEKQRQMTTDLGFAWLRSAEGDEIGIIDVPGHLDFIENMIAGVGGISAVLLVIAADEGVMPQTREHLAIISLLKISRGIIVLTKCDKVDEEWLELVEADIRETLTDSTLADAAIMRVSALSGEGIEDLKRAIFQLVEFEEAIPDRGKPFLAIDRVFSITGFGTVVTGTLKNGSLAVGTIVQIPRTGKTARIRGLQTHKIAENTVLPGRRAAVNLTGIDKDEIQRGDILCLPGTFAPSRRWDAKIELLNEVKNGIRHNDQVKVFIHTAESVGRIRLLKKASLLAGESGWVQIEFDREMVADEGDRFIIRRLSPGETLGGGVVVNAHPLKRYRLRDELALSVLTRSDTHKADQVALHIFNDNPFMTRQMIVCRSGRSMELVEAFLQKGMLEMQVTCLDPENGSEAVFTTAAYWRELTGKMLRQLHKYHENQPLSLGIPSGELLSSLRIPRPFATMCLSKWQGTGEIKVQHGLVASVDHEVVFSPAARLRIQKYFEKMAQAPYSPPSIKESKELLGDVLYQSLLEQGSIIQIDADVVFSQTAYSEMLAHVTREWGDGRLFTVAEFRDHFQTSRKYALAFLEYLDKKRITVREGEGRRVAGKGL